MNNNDPPNKRVCIHNSASSKVTPTPTPVSRKFVTLLFTFSLYHLIISLLIPTLQLPHSLLLSGKALLAPSMKSCQSLLVRGVLMK